MVKNDSSLQLIENGYKAYQQLDYEAAAGYYAKALQLEPDNRDANLGAGATAILNHEYVLAENLYRHLLHLNADDEDAFRSILQLAEFDKAIESDMLDHANRHARAPAALFAILGDHYSVQERWSDAVNAYTKSVANDQVPDVLFNLAVSLEHIGAPLEALPFYRQSLNADGDSRFDRMAARRRIAMIQKLTDQ